MTPKKRRNIPQLIKAYRKINEYILSHYEAPSMQKLIDAGLCKSKNTVSAWFVGMVELHMARRTDSGSIYLLPLENAAPEVRALLNK